jgi:amino acid transporter
VTELKTKMAVAVILAILSAFLLVGISYLLFPDQTPQQSPIPMPTSKPEPLLDQILWAIEWIGLAALIAITIVGAVFIINRIIREKTPKHPFIAKFYKSLQSQF